MVKGGGNKLAAEKEATWPIPHSSLSDFSPFSLLLLFFFFFRIDNDPATSCGILNTFKDPAKKK